MHDRISDVDKAYRTIFHMENRGRLYLFLRFIIKQEEDKIKVDKERKKKNEA